MLFEARTRSSSDRGAPNRLQSTLTEKTGEDFQEVRPLKQSLVR